MFDIRANGEIVAELERILVRARAGEIKAIAVAALDRQHNGDAFVKMMPEAILLPAIIGSLTLLQSDLIAMVQAEQARQRAIGR